MHFTEEQFEYDMLVERWSGFEQRLFPGGWGGMEVAGICLVTLDSDLNCDVSSYVERRRQFHPKGVEYLRRRHDDLRRVLPSLTGEAHGYFSELDELVATTLRLLDGQ